MSDEGRLLVGIEKTQSHIVIRAGRRRHEGHLGMRELARHVLQKGIALAIRVQDHRCRVALESRFGKCVYLEYAQCSLRSLPRSFARLRALRLHFIEPWGGLQRPETWAIEYSVGL